MLHVGNRLAANIQLGRDPVEAVGVQTDQRLGDHSGGITLVGDRDPVVA